MRKNEMLKLPPKHNFWLNPYDEYAFTKCPKCEGKTKVKKIVLVMHTGTKDGNFLNINKEVKYCPACDLIIAKESELRNLAGTITGKTVSKEHFLILGTMERKHWLQFKNAKLFTSDLFDYVIPFKEQIAFTIRPAGWYKE